MLKNVLFIFSRNNLTINSFRFIPLAIYTRKDDFENSYLWW